MKILIPALLLTCLIVTGCNSAPSQTIEEARQHSSSTPQEVATEETTQEYELPTERVVAYQNYSIEKLWNQSTGKPGLMDADVTPVAITFPRYPEQAFLNGIEGDVTVTFTAPNYNTTVKQVRVTSSQPDDTFTSSVLNAMSRWKFSPLTIKREKYTVTNISALIKFRIEAGKPVVYFRYVDGSMGPYPPDAISVEIE